VKPIDINLERPIKCTIIQRVNRFVVEIRLEKNLERAHINNTGRLERFLLNGNQGFCYKNERPLKTAYRLFAIREGNSAAIIDTQLQMNAFEKALEAGLIPWLDGYAIMKRNARLGDSVIDYLLVGDGKQVYLEIKSAVLREAHYAMYPDCPTVRGRRHIRELIEHRKSGGSASILFIAALPGVGAFKPSRAGDPELADLLVSAKEIGVDIRAIALLYNPHDSLIYLYHPDLPVEL
jgi:sugar fermentation stimulation protein A